VGREVGMNNKLRYWIDRLFLRRCWRCVSNLEGDELWYGKWGQRWVAFELARDDKYESYVEYEHQSNGKRKSVDERGRP
jgi:hypothetical protein